jgi:phosphomevalonate kinase
LRSIKDYYRHLEELSSVSGLAIITPEHKQLAEIAFAYGRQYKPSGAGGGYIGIVLTDSESKTSKILEEASAFGFSVIEHIWGTKGVTVS